MKNCLRSKKKTGGTNIVLGSVISELEEWKSEKEFQGAVKVGRKVSRIWGKEEKFDRPT